MLLELTFWEYKQKNILRRQALLHHTYWNTLLNNSLILGKKGKKYSSWFSSTDVTEEVFHFIMSTETHCNFPGGCSSLGGGAETEGLAGVEVGAAAGGAREDGSLASAGISTCFQSCPSSTSRPISEPKRTFLLPSST